MGWPKDDDKWCLGNDGAWRLEQAEIARQRAWRARREAQHAAMVEKCGDAIGGFDLKEPEA